MRLRLRDYQLEALDYLDRALDAGKNPVIKLPTGAGKSLVLASLIKRRRQRTLVLSHVKELLKQDAQTLRRVDPAIHQGFFSAGLKEKHGGAHVVFGSVQSVYRSLHSLGSRNLILIDEAHLCPRESEAMYARCFSHFSLAQRAGFTATDERMDSGKLTEGKDAWFDCLAYEAPVSKLIKAGWLVPLVGVLTEHQADLSEVGTRQGDFIQEQAERAVSALSIEEVVDEVVRLAKKRKHWLIFAAGVKHARIVRDRLRSEGVSCGMVLGETSSEKREATIDAFREGSIRALVNVGVLTTGFDAPLTDCLVSLRPTKSSVLWTQMLGRGMRTADGKENCLLLDFVGNLERLGGAGCVVEVRDLRLPQEKKRSSGKRSRKVERKVEFQLASLADPMKTGQSFQARVIRTRAFAVNSRRHEGKQLIVVVYDLEDEEGRALQARTFVNLEYPGTARHHAVRFFVRRGIEAESVPARCASALPLIKICPEPTEVLARWDAKMKTYLVDNERFEEMPA